MILSGLLQQISLYWSSLCHHDFPFQYFHCFSSTYIFFNLFPLCYLSHFRMEIFTCAAPEATNVQRLVFADLSVPEGCAPPDGTLSLHVFHTVSNRVTEGATILFSAVTPVPPLASSPVLPLQLLPLLQTVGPLSFSGLHELGRNWVQGNQTVYHLS